MRSKAPRGLLITVRVNSDEKKLIEANAFACGMDTADYLRQGGMSGWGTKLSEPRRLTDVSIKPHSPDSATARALPGHSRSLKSHRQA